ncbi:MAG: glycerol-3-phosphate 1-O-acyltransferase PlsY [Janthinobacterium lividum]
MTYTHSLALILLAYLFGSLPIGLLVGRMVKGIDVRDYGSGNIGATNVWRTMGPLWGTAVFLFDFCKGYLPTVLTVQMTHLHDETPWLPVVVGLAAILGHNFSPFLRFKGGKGVATSVGVVFGLSPFAAVVGFVVWGVCLLATRYISVSSMVAAVLTSIALIFFHHDPPHILFGLLVALFVILKHRPNIARLKAGTEPKVKAAIGTKVKAGP